MMQDLSMENKKLNDILVSNKLNFEEEIRDVKTRARDEAIKSSQHVSRTFDQKIKIVEDSKEMILRKNQELLRALQEKEREIGDLDGERTEEISKLRQDCGDLSQQNNHINFLLNKYKQEIAEKDSMIGRSMNDNDNELMTLRQQLDSKKSENTQLATNMR